MANENARNYWGNTDRVATWPLREQFTGAFIAPLLEYAAISPGAAVVDLGCGGGVSTFSASVMTGPRGSVHGVDISQAMVGLALARRNDQGMDNVSFEVNDLETGNREGAPFDEAISLFGVMFFDDPVAAFANIGRQCKTGAKLTFATWQRAEHNRWSISRRLGDQLSGTTSPQHNVGTYVPGQFGFANREQTSALLNAAGWTAIEWALSEEVVEATFASLVDDASLTLAGIGVDRHGEARELARELLSPYHLRDDRYRCTLAAQLCTMRLDA